MEAEVLPGTSALSGGRLELCEDIRCAPNPTDTDLGWPIEAMTVIWDTGYLTIELSALTKMPAAKRNKIYKLGGL